jgi:amino acid transporter
MPFVSLDMISYAAGLNRAAVLGLGLVTGLPLLWAAVRLRLKMKIDDERLREEQHLSLPGAVAMGTGVMIGAGIFALTGQIAELAGPLFPVSFIAGAIVTAFSAYTYIKMSNAYPSAGGIGMILKKASGPTTVAAGAALLMALSMVINESRVARTFGTYTLRAFGGDPDSVLVPVLGVFMDS